MQNLFLESQTTQYGSHMVMTGSKLPPRHVYINIDSRFRDDANSSSIVDYTFTLPQPINGVRSMQIVSMEIPYTINNISSNYNNNVFYLCYNKNNTSTGKTVTVPNNYYSSVPTLVSAINSQIQELDASYNTFAITTSKSSVTGQYNCFLDNSAGAHSIQVFFNNKPSLDRIGGGGADARNTLGWKMGFRDPTYTVNEGYTISGETMADILSPKYIYLVIEDYTKSSTVNSFISPFYMSIMNKNLIAKIPVSSAVSGMQYSFGDMMNVSIINGSLFSDTRTYDGTGVNLQKLRIQLVDEFGKVLDLNEMDFSFTMKLQL